MVTLRPYQDKLVADLRHAFNVLRFLRVLLVLSTGGGKTIIFCFIAWRFMMAGKRVWILAHRDELLSQISRSLDTFGVRHGVMRRGSNGTWHDVQVCSVQTLARRLGRGLTPPDLIVLDEAHHAVAGSWAKVLQAYPDVPVLGVTATPCRLDGKGLGDVFQHMVLGPSAADLTRAGYLASAVVYAPPLMDTAGLHTRMGDYNATEVADRVDRPTICGEAVTHYRKLAMGKRIIVFCVNLKHVEHTVDAYTAAGIPAASLDGKLTTADRMQRVEDFSAGRLLVLVTCELVNEGFDVPGCDGVQQLRPTQSLSLHLQQIGRALRPAPGKTEALILDHVRNWERHGLPTDPRDWELTSGRVRRSNAEATVGVRQCKECALIYPSFASQCPRCGETAPVKDRTPEVVAGELALVAAAEREPVSAEERAEILKGPHSIQEWHAIRKRLGYKPGWAWRMFSEQQGQRG